MEPRDRHNSLCRLAVMCLDAACDGRESVQAWRRQKRTLERLPLPLAQPLFHRLLHSGLLNAPLLEIFEQCVEEVNVCGEAAVDAEWTSYFGAFHSLRVFEAADCKSISNFALLQLKGLKMLEQLNVSRCAKITDEGLAHILSLTSLRRLGISETGITVKGLHNLSALPSLTSLDLGGLPVTDSVLSSLLALKQLQRLDIWGTRVSDNGALLLKGFPHLEHLNLAWTGITQIPPLLFLKHVNMANCSVSSIFGIWESLESPPLQELVLSGAKIVDSSKVLAGSWASNVLVADLSASNVTDFGALSRMRKIEFLDLSGTATPDLAMETIAEIGLTLKRLDLSGAKVGSPGIGVLADRVPELEQLSLSGTLVDDSVFPFLARMPTLKRVDLSYTIIKGYYYESGKPLKLSSFAAIERLHSLTELNLRNSLISDQGCRRLACLVQLTHIHLRSDLLSDFSLPFLSQLKNLVVLGTEGAMMTDSGLFQFRPPPLLKELNISDCWLLTYKGILQFCEKNKNRGLLVRHELLPRGSNMLLGSLEGVSVKGMRYKGSAHGQVTKPTKLKVASRMTGWQSKDERIRYRRTDLLDLCPSSDCKQELSMDLSKICSELLDAEPHLLGSVSKRQNDKP